MGSQGYATREQWLAFVETLKRELPKRSEEEQRAYLKTLDESIIRKLAHEWRYFARDDQIEPTDEYDTWLYMAGRGAGKTRSAAEYVIENVRYGGYRRVALVGASASDCRDTMVEGESGILTVSPPDFMPEYEPSKRRLTWPNGAIATTFSADKPAQLRGPNNDLAWVDELTKFRYDEEVWDMLQMTLRKGEHPKCIVTTTPRPTKTLKAILSDPRTITTTATTFDNAANLAGAFLRRMRDKYEGTRLGRQELFAEVLDDNPHALFQLSVIERLRVKDHPQLKRIVVAVDPSGSSTGDEAGIVAAGLGIDGQAYVLEDRSLQGTPEQWARRAVELYADLEADRMIGEKNYGGEMVRTTIHSIDSKVPVTLVSASRGKLLRAEPVSSLYEQGRVHHVGAFPQLEDEMTEWQPGGPSPNRMDALVFALTELMLKQEPKATIGAVMVPI